ncbi:MAG: hypothetical protein ACFCBU_15255 [Cyanophyceae cyanobacterium]
MVVESAEDRQQLPTGWQSPDKELLDILHAPPFPRVWIGPTGEYMLLADPVLYPPLSELAAPMHKLAGLRVNPAINSHQGHHGSKFPRLLSVENGTETPLELPADTEIHSVKWTADGQRFALMVRSTDHVGLWVGSVSGEMSEIDGLSLNPLLGVAVSWLPDQERMLARRIPERGAAPQLPKTPTGPQILEGSKASARSTYEARNLLETAHDDALFEYYASSELVILDPTTEEVNVVGESAPYIKARFSPSGEYLLVERLVSPWSHEVAWWRFAREVEGWTVEGE